MSGCGCVDFDIVAEVELCFDDSPDGYVCTRPDGHDGAHTAWLGGRLLDTWVRDVTAR